jgi:hypothetical protein
VSERAVFVEVPGGPRLEARLAVPSEPTGGLVVAHPHPLYGGDMENPVVVRAVEVSQAAGLASLRFNFRGVGGSSGTHDGGKGEQDDAAAALERLAAALPPGSPLGLAGYSFGASVMARLAGRTSSIRALCLIAPPVAMIEFEPLPSGLDMLLVAGTRDSYCSVDALFRLAGGPARAETVIVEGADHFFFGKLFPLGVAVERWARRWAPAAQGR